MWARLKSWCLHSGSWMLGSVLGWLAGATISSEPLYPFFGAITGAFIGLFAALPWLPRSENTTLPSDFMDWG